MKTHISIIAKLLAGAGVLLIIAGCNNGKTDDASGHASGGHRNDKYVNEDMRNSDPAVDGTGSKNNGDNSRNDNSNDNERYVPGGNYGNNTSGNSNGEYTAGSSGNSNNTSAGGNTSGYEAGKGNSDNRKHSYNTQSTSPNEKNKSFLKEAAELNLEEIQLGDLAMKKGTTSDIQHLGEMMMTNHRTSLDELTQMSRRKNWKIPTDAGPLAQSKFNDLNSYTGHAFDKVYCEMMVDGHKKAIARFERASREVTDKDLKNWAKKTLPTLRKHLEHAQASLKKTTVAQQ